ncbi:hypothetical protein GCM10007860_34980 [Chitiniphilus shinanonensis]|uniref:Lipoprotein n=1 Tax=Chitiniphilus shinanonensis TaxID=553088 RepID=A0ABQ6BYV2_9NEIS|nr:hypothetical protein GCM10007860_34980 [Chitiniphilus shinanonensis]
MNAGRAHGGADRHDACAPPPEANRSVKSAPLLPCLLPWLLAAPLASAAPPDTEPAPADASTAEAAPPPRGDSVFDLGYEGRVTPLPEQAIPAVPGAEGSKPPPRQWNHALPFFAQRVIDKGYNLPNPYDIGLSYYYSKQNMLLSNLEVSLGDRALRNAGFVQFPTSTLENRSEQIQVGAWLFPFLNVYAIGGHIKGGGDIGISMSADDMVRFVTGQDPCSRRIKPDWCGKTLSATARANYHGYSYGAGFTLAGNVKQLYFSLPVTYTVSSVSMSDTDAKTWNIAPRVGLNWSLGGWGTVMTYVGATWLHADVTITGSVTMPTAQTDIGRDVDLNFSIDEKIAAPWNGLAGFHWMVNRNISLLGEVGFGQRQGYILSSFLRF